MCVPLVRLGAGAQGRRIRGATADWRRPAHDVPHHPTGELVHIAIAAAAAVYRASIPAVVHCHGDHIYDLAQKRDLQSAQSAYALYYFIYTAITIRPQNAEQNCTDRGSAVS